MIVKTPGSQMGSPAAAEGGGEVGIGGRGARGEKSGVQARSTFIVISFCSGRDRKVYYKTTTNRGKR